MRDFQTDEVAKHMYHEDFRPQFHFSPPVGWHNDPNGLVFYEGEYHLFYQYNPYDVVWGPMHWGHAVSIDMIRWKNLPIALYPDRLGTIFSGTVVVDEKDTSGFFNGKGGLVAIFTHHEEANGRECQSVAYSADRGRTWTKYAGNPVLKGDESKEFKDFRDPKVFWHEERGKWIMFLGGGAYRVYGSDNLTEWTLESECSVWEEFPDIFRLPVDGNRQDQKWVLSTAGYGYYAGDFDGRRFQAEQPYRNVDFGKSWQAAYCFNHFPDRDRCVWMGWMRDSATGPTFPWRCNFSIPRELALKTTPFGLTVTQRPVKELATLWGKTFSFQRVPLRPGNNPLKALRSNTFDLEAEFRYADDAEFGVEFLKGGTVRTVAKYSPQTRVAVLDVLRSSAPEYQAFETPFRTMMRGDVCILAKSSEAYLNPEGRVLRIRILADVSSVEVFFGDGEVVFSNSVYPPAHCREINVFTSGGGVTLESCRVRYLKSIWE